MAQSKAVWDAKVAGEELNLQWENHAPSHTCKGGGRCCNVCLSEKLGIR